VTYVEIYVVYLDVSQVVGHDLGHGSPAGDHQHVPTPKTVVECFPGGFEELQALSHIGAEMGCRAVSAKVGSDVRIVPIGVDRADLAGGRAVE
jgi:hypothetical protein